MARNLFGPKDTRSAGRTGGDRRVRIDHPHYVSRDEYECGVCGERFRRNTMTCPHCGTLLERRVTDKREYDEELEEELEMDDWDDEDGC